MENTNKKGFKAFLTKKDIVFSAKRYGIDALGAMAQGLFASLLIGTILKTLGQQAGIDVLVEIGTFAQGATGPAMAVAIGYALKCPPLVLFSLVAVGSAANSLGGAGGPLSVLIITIFAAEFGKLVSKETKIDILVTPIITILVGVGLAVLIAEPIGSAARSVGIAIMWATELRPFFMGILVSAIIGIVLLASGASKTLTDLGTVYLVGACVMFFGIIQLSTLTKTPKEEETEEPSKKRKKKKQEPEKKKESHKIMIVCCVVSLVIGGLAIYNSFVSFVSVDKLIAYNIVMQGVNVVQIALDTYKNQVI